VSPSAVKSNRDVLQLQTSAWDGKSFWMLVNHDGSVCIKNQRLGEPTTESIHIPRRTFQAMLDWYEREQIPRPDARDERSGRRTNTMTETETPST
jgi:hypothetical protein